VQIVAEVHPAYLSSSHHPLLPGRYLKDFMLVHSMATAARSCPGVPWRCGWLQDTKAEVFVAAAVEEGLRYSLLQLKALKAAAATVGAPATAGAALTTPAPANATAPATSPVTPPAASTPIAGTDSSQTVGGSVVQGWEGLPVRPVLGGQGQRRRRGQQGARWRQRWANCSRSSSPLSTGSAR